MPVSDKPPQVFLKDQSEVVGINWIELHTFYSLLC